MKIIRLSFMPNFCFRFPPDYLSVFLFKTITLPCQHNFVHNTFHFFNIWSKHGSNLSLDFLHNVIKRSMWIACSSGHIFLFFGLHWEELHLFKLKNHHYFISTISVKGIFIKLGVNFSQLLCNNYYSTLFQNYYFWIILACATKFSWHLILFFPPKIKASNVIQLIKKKANPNGYFIGLPKEDPLWCDG